MWETDCPIKNGQCGFPRLADKLDLGPELERGKPVIQFAGIPELLAPQRRRLAVRKVVIPVDPEPSINCVRVPQRDKFASAADWMIDVDGMFTSHADRFIKLGVARADRDLSSHEPEQIELSQHRAEFTRIP